MMPLPKTLACSLALLTLLSVACNDGALTDPGSEMQGPTFAKGHPGPPSGHEAGNNLSYPVIWAEGVTKVAPGTPGMVPLLTSLCATTEYPGQPSARHRSRMRTWCGLSYRRTPRTSGRRDRSTVRWRLSRST